MVNRMLALSRKKGEALVINNNVEITILEIKGEQVKIGITALAPNSVAFSITVNCASLLKGD